MTPALLVTGFLMGIATAVFLGPLVHKCPLPPKLPPHQCPPLPPPFSPEQYFSSKQYTLDYCSHLRKQSEAYARSLDEKHKKYIQECKERGEYPCWVPAFKRTIANQTK